jgi:FkbM family methyltransferase
MSSTRREPSVAVARAIRETGRTIDFYKRSASARRMRLMERLEIDLVLDLGANTGQHAKGLRREGYAGRIVSFEPLAGAFQRLSRSAARDPRWTAVHLGLGARDHEATLHVSGDSRSSSLQRMLPRHREAAAYFAPVGEERVAIRKLDSIWDDHVPSDSRVYLKIDTQGHEAEVLRGAVRSLEKVSAVQMEISIQALYAGERLLPDVLRGMARRGFTLVSLEYGFCDPNTAEMLQVDGIFTKTPGPRAAPREISRRSRPGSRPPAARSR